MLSVKVNLSGDKQFMEKLAKIGPAITDFRDAFKVIGDKMVEYYSGQAFKSQGGVFGEPWAGLAPSTQTYKKSHFRQYTNVPLIASGTMRDSFQATASPLKLVVSNTAPYFVYHQSSAPRTKLPRRQMMGINNDIKGIIQVAIEADLKAKIGLL